MCLGVNQAVNLASMLPRMLNNDVQAVDFTGNTDWGAASSILCPSPTSQVTLSAKTALTNGSLGIPVIRKS